jgi:predicted anti-sigma-YlaC factor YlaD
MARRPCCRITDGRKGPSNLRAGVEHESVDKRKIDCEEVLDNLRDYLDDEARAELKRAIEEHLRHCHGCQVEIDTIHKTIKLYRNDRVTEVPLRAHTDLRAALKRAYEGQG